MTERTLFDIRRTEAFSIPVSPCEITSAGSDRGLLLVADLPEVGQTAHWFAKVVVMSERSPEQRVDQIRELLDSLYRVDSRRILATLIRLLGDFDLAEEAMHEAFAAALSLWPTSGVPGNPRPWLISTARFKAIDTLRRRARFDASQDQLARHLETQSSSAQGSSDDDFLEDDRL